MANFGRSLGASIFTLMQNRGLDREKLAEKLNYSYCDVCRIIEGRLFVSPRELCRIAEVLGTTKKGLLDCKIDTPVPELQYMKGFSNPENLDKVLDLLDEYVELKEAL